MADNTKQGWRWTADGYAQLYSKVDGESIFTVRSTAEGSVIVFHCSVIGIDVALNTTTGGA
jgi:hypothetical protein